MSLLTNECKICGDALMKGHAYQLLDDYVCLDCYSWANKMLNELTKNVICDTIEK